MRIIIIPDSFKGTMSSLKVIERIKLGLLQHFETLEILEIPIADGGEGTVDALVRAMNGLVHVCEVQDALGRSTVSRYGICGKLAVLEMAEASGLCKINAQERNLMEASTFGVGELILKALDHEVDEIVIGIGGSATNDGGVGMLQALGVEFYDADGHLLSGGGKILDKIHGIETEKMDQRLLKTPITVMCDVSNPLTGEKGATYVYGPQKGGDIATLKRLEAGMQNYKMQILKHTQIDVDQIPGSGAAGGLGAALVSFLGAELKPGIELILDLVGFDQLIDDADLVITGEGRIDEQTVYGKVPTGIAKRCLDKPVKVIAIAGAEGNEAKRVYEYGIDVILSTVTQCMDDQTLLATAESRLDAAVDTLCRMLKIGISLNK